ncbi:MAG: hypothetical protein WCY88_02175 [Spongiibacteraceae bacterium]
MLNKLMLSLIVVMAVFISGCEKDGPAERAGENMDDAVEQMQDQGRDLGNKIEDACEDMKEGAGAQDTDC